MFGSKLTGKVLEDAWDFAFLGLLVPEDNGGIDLFGVELTKLQRVLVEFVNLLLDVVVFLSCCLFKRYNALAD